MNPTLAHIIYTAVTSVITVVIVTKVLTFIDSRHPTK